MPNPEAVATYEDAGGSRHSVVACPADAKDRWEVLDIGVNGTTVIERLQGEGQPEAEAIAREYARDQQSRHRAVARRHSH